MFKNRRNLEIIFLCVVTETETFKIVQVPVPGTMSRSFVDGSTSLDEPVPRNSDGPFSETRRAVRTFFFFLLIFARDSDAAIFFAYFLPPLAEEGGTRRRPAHSSAGRARFPGGRDAPQNHMVDRPFAAI